ncbi:MAG: DUF5995 family protein, partial [Cyclobacteriaceae bacterium]
MTLPQTIDDVLDELDKIIEQSFQDNDYIAIFAYVYRRTTAAIKEGIEREQFEDGKRMERFDVIFANLYLQAYQQYRAAQRPCLSWHTCFEARHARITLLQHILMGMNAHINLDLGIAAARTSEGRHILDMKDDFMKVNYILYSIIDDIQASISKVSRLMFVIDWLGGRKDEQMIDFGIRRYREQAWRVACELALAREEDKDSLIAEVDLKTSKLNQHIRNPHSILLRMMLRLVSIFEIRDTRKILEILQAGERRIEPAYLAARQEKPEIIKK